MSGQTDVEVCIISHNARADLEVCLTRLHQVMPTGLSVAVTVVDNTGADGSTEYVQNAWPRVRLITNVAPLGFGANINRVIEQSNARYALVMNPDVVLSAGAIEALVAYMDRNPGVGLCGPKTYYPDGRLQPTCRQFPNWNTVLWRWLKLERLAQPPFYRRFLMLDWDHNDARPVDWIMGCCMMVRQAAFAKTVGFDESFFLYYEDIDLCRRMWQSGYAVHYLPEAEITHAYRRQSGRGLLNSMTLIHVASILRYRRKHGMAAGQVRWSPVYLLPVLIVGDLAVTELALQVGRYARLWLPILGAYPYPNPSPLRGVIYLIVPLIWLAVFLLLGLYNPDRLKRSIRAPGKLLSGVMVSGLVLAGSLYALFLSQVYIPRLLLIYFLLADAALLLGWRQLLHQILSRNGLIYRPRALLVGAADVAENVVRWINADSRPPVDLIGAIPWPAGDDALARAGYIEETARQLHIEAAILTPPFPSRETISTTVSALQKYGVETKVIPDSLDIDLNRARYETLYGLTAINIQPSAPEGAWRIIGRLLGVLR